MLLVGDPIVLYVWVGKCQPCNAAFLARPAETWARDGGRRAECPYCQRHTAVWRESVPFRPPQENPGVHRD